jgi:branched-chain amino acid aminotransferase
MYLHNTTLHTQGTPSIALNDFGFSRGVTVFELFRVYGDQPFCLPEHLARLQHGAHHFGIALPLSLELLSKHAHTLIHHYGYAHSAIKIYLTAGVPATSSGLSFAACQAFAPNLIMMLDEVKPQHPTAPYGLEKYQRGQALATVHQTRELPHLKSANYGAAYYAARSLAPAGTDDILFTTPNNLVTEATRSNFFCVLNGILTTPRQGMLHGITRHVVLQLAANLGIPTAEADLTPAMLAQASEAFTTGSIAELVPTRSINHQILPHATDGNAMQAPVFSALRHAFTSATQTHASTFTLPHYANTLTATSPIPTNPITQAA